MGSGPREEDDLIFLTLNVHSYVVRRSFITLSSAPLSTESCLTRALCCDEAVSLSFKCLNFQTLIRLWFTQISKDSCGPLVNIQWYSVRDGGN